MSSYSRHVIPEKSKIKILIETNEKKFSSNGFDVPYLLLRGSDYQKYLVVIFSAFDDDKSEASHSYNYVRTLMDFNGNKLFILDYVGPKGSYYLGKAPDYLFAKAVNELIESARKELSIDAENVICIGGSKGGTSALYHGVVGNYGSIIAGTPQTKIASYVQKCSLQTYDFMFEGKKEWIDFADRILIETCKKKIDSDVWIITSPLDWQYEEHIEPFIDEVGHNFNHLRLIFSKEIRVHADIGNYFIKNLSHLLVDFILEKARSVCQLDLIDYFRTYHAVDNNLFDFDTKTLSLPGGKVIYLQAFDNNFETPPKEEKNLRMSRIPPGHRNLVARIDFSTTGNVNFVFFIMQYIPGNNTSIKDKKMVQYEAGHHMLEFPIKLDPKAMWVKIALRYQGDNKCNIIIHRVVEYYTSW